MAHRRLFGERFRELIRGQSQGAVAERLGVSQAYVSRMAQWVVPSRQVL